MSRPLSQLDPSASPLAAFAHELRVARVAAGEPTLDVMVKRSNVGRTALSSAMSGRRLPTAQVVEGFLTGCECDDGTIARLLAKRAELAALPADELHRPVATPAAAGAASSGADSANETIQVTGPAGGRRLPRTVTAIVAVLILVIGGGVGFAIGRSTADPRPQATASHAPRDGDDPVAAGCTADAVTGAAKPQPDGTLVELMWSAKCSANWGRITLAGEENGDSITVVLTGHFKNAPNPQTRTVNGQQSTYTPLLVMGPSDKACVTGSWATGAMTTEVTYPACG